MQSQFGIESESNIKKNTKIINDAINYLLDNSSSLWMDGICLF